MADIRLVKINSSGGAHTNPDREIWLVPLVRLNCNIHAKYEAKIIKHNDYNKLVKLWVCFCPTVVKKNSQILGNGLPNFPPFNKDQNWQ